MENDIEIERLKEQIASDCGLSREWVPRLKGTDEKSIRADAVELMKLTGGYGVIPTKNTEMLSRSSRPGDEAYLLLLDHLNQKLR